MIAFVKEGFRASFSALKTSWSQYLQWETKHNKEQVSSEGKTGEGRSGRWAFTTGSHSGCPTDAGKLLTGLLKDEWYRLKHQKNRPWGESPSLGKQVPAKFCWILSTMSSLRGQTSSSRGATSRDRDRPAVPWLRAPSTSTGLTHRGQPSKVG